MKRLLSHPSLPVVLGIAALLIAGLLVAAYALFPHLFRAQAAGEKVKGAVEAVTAALPLEPEPAGMTPASGSYVLEVRNQYVQDGRKFVEADLTSMTLRVYESGRVMLEVPIKGKGKEGSWWETPVGVYSVKNKEENHFSTFGKVYQPWSLVFQGNFFIHGWPYYPDGTPVSTSYSGGCIRLADENARLVYDAVEVGTPVLVYKVPKGAAPLADPAGNPEVSGSYAVLDVPTGTSIRSRDAGRDVPLGNAVHLLAALTAVDYVNVESGIAVDASSPRLAGMSRASVLDLLRLLLSEHDEAAARSIAEARNGEAFVRYMNAKAKAIGMAHTSVTSAHAADAGNRTTIGDIALLVRYLEENRSFVLRLTQSARGNLAYDPPVWDDLAFDDALLALPGFYGGVDAAHGAPAAASVTVTVDGAKRDVVIVAESLAGIREAASWLAR